MIPSYKSKLINLMRTLAQKEYLSDPSSIFDIPQNQNLQQLTSQFQFDATEAVQAMNELVQVKEAHNEVLQQRELVKQEAQKKAKASNDDDDDDDDDDSEDDDSDDDDDDQESPGK